MEAPKAVVFFDGYCVLCDGFLSWVLEHDKSRRLVFAPLQGETARARGIAVSNDLTPSSVILLDGEKLYEKSAAILKTLTYLPRLYSWFGIFLLVPAPIRDCIYDCVARNRYRWFGRRDVCRLPSPEERSRFLP